MRQLAHVLFGDAGLVAHLQDQRRDDGDQVGVTATFAEAVQGPLHVAHPGAHGGQRDGDGVAGVIVGVDAETITGNVFDDLCDDVLGLVR